MSTITAAVRSDTALRLTFALAVLAFALLSALDVADTAYGLAHGGSEINGLVRVLIGRNGPWAFAAIKATTAGAYLGICALVYLWFQGRWRWLSVGFLLGMAVWLAALLGHNAASLLSLLR